MQVSLRVTHGPTPEVWNLGLVAFEFSGVRDPHEMLQDEPRFRQWEVAPENRDRIAGELRTALMDSHRGLLNRRGALWAIDSQLAPLRVLTGWQEPWEAKQVMCPSTLLWAARRVPAVHFRVPAISGLTVGNALHEAVQQAVLLQGAFRALTLNKDVRSKSPKVLLPPTM